MIDRNARSTTCFAGTPAAAGVAFLVFACVANAEVQLAVLGAVVCLAAVVAAEEFREQRRTRTELADAICRLPVAFALTEELGFSSAYQKVSRAFTDIVQQKDRLYLELARHRLDTMATEAVTLAKGYVVFQRTETWRAAYQRVLETLRVKTYYSVAWVRTPDYWNDEPGRQSMRFNYELISRGFRIERVHILPDELWPFEQKLPSSAMLEWLVEQQGRGIIVSLVRESDLGDEPELLADFAVYGDRAVGTQELDEGSQTRRFVLSFNQDELREALGRWERLALFARPFQNLVDP